MLPDIDRFSCYTGMDPDPALIPADDGENSRSPSMSTERIRADLPELVAAAGRLIERKLSYPAAMSDHVDRLLRLYRGDHTRIWSVDSDHHAYLPA